ncbi:MAG: biosynthetic arginine decarboxylase [Verrucomicrobiota bacterium]
MTKKHSPWSSSTSTDLYGVERWGADLFRINAAGDVEALLAEAGSDEIVPVSLREVLQGLQERGMDLPVVLRFPHFLTRQIDRINQTFGDVMRSLAYKGDYRGVYPIKVNQQAQVVNAITAAGKRWHFGLEAGSKPELIAALAHLDDPEAVIICNGYKDQEFIDLALHANELGLRVFIVLEMPEELSLVLQRAKALGISPRLGLRVKLSTESAGHWNDSGGDRSVFGLNVSQLVNVVDQLKEAGQIESLQLLHYHQGSQIPNIRSIREAAAEAARYYTCLVQEGAPMGFLDIGGGLAVDYDGSKTNFSGSCNYGLHEYCTDVIETIMQVLDAAEVPHPTIINESGRALVAYSSVLLFNVFSVTEFTPKALPEELPPDPPVMLKNLWAAYRSIQPKNLQESFNDAVYYRGEMAALFTRGEISLRERALGDRIYWHILWKVSQVAPSLGKYAPPDLAEITAALVDIYHVNFSVFQSLPDAWAIEQLFPVMPIHRLNERPDQRGILADITCDCDGKIDRFIDFHGIGKELPLHQLREGEDYILGTFLIGAYQETLGDLHNLLGDTHVISVGIENGEFSVEEEIAGDTVTEVLSYVEYDPADLSAAFRRLAERGVRQRRITPARRRDIVTLFEKVLRGYTYFNDRTLTQAEVEARA